MSNYMLNRRGDVNVAEENKNSSAIKLNFVAPFLVEKTICENPFVQNWLMLLQSINLISHKTGQ